MGLPEAFTAAELDWRDGDASCQPGIGAEEIAEHEHRIVWDDVLRRLEKPDSVHGRQ